MVGDDWVSGASPQFGGHELGVEHCRTAIVVGDYQTLLTSPLN